MKKNLKKTLALSLLTSGIAFGVIMFNQSNVQAEDRTVSTEISLNANQYLGMMILNREIANNNNEIDLLLQITRLMIRINCQPELEQIRKALNLDDPRMEAIVCAKLACEHGLTTKVIKGNNQYFCIVEINNKNYCVDFNTARRNLGQNNPDQEDLLEHNQISNYFLTDIKTLIDNNPDCAIPNDDDNKWIFKTCINQLSILKRTAYGNFPLNDNQIFGIAIINHDLVDNNNEIDLLLQITKLMARINCQPELKQLREVLNLADPKMEAVVCAKLACVHGIETKVIKGRNQYFCVVKINNKNYCVDFKTASRNLCHTTNPQHESLFENNQISKYFLTDIKTLITNNHDCAILDDPDHHWIFETCIHQLPIFKRNSHCGVPLDYKFAIECYTTNNIVLSPEEIEKCQKILTDADKCGITADMSEIERYQRIRNYVLKDFQYSEHSPAIDSPLAFLTTKNTKLGCCRTIASAAEILLTLAGLPTKVILTNDHVFNMVTIGNQNYCFDWCWMSKEDRIYSNDHYSLKHTYCSYKINQVADLVSYQAIKSLDQYNECCQDRLTPQSERDCHSHDVEYYYNQLKTEDPTNVDYFNDIFGTRLFPALYSCTTNYNWHGNSGYQLIRPTNQLKRSFSYTLWQHDSDQRS